MDQTYTMPPPIFLPPLQIQQIALKPRNLRIMRNSLHRHALRFKPARRVDLIIPVRFPLVKVIRFLLQTGQTINKRLKHFDIVIPIRLSFRPVKQFLAFFLQVTRVVVDFERDDGLLGEFEDEEDPDLREEGVVGPAGVDVFGHPGVCFVAGARERVGGGRAGGGAGEAKVDGGGAGDVLEGRGVACGC